MKRLVGSAPPAPLIVVQKPFFDQFLAGQKTIEFRRHRPPFTDRVFYAGRRVLITFRYGGAPRLPATVDRFETKPLHTEPDIIGFYRDVGLNDEIALIHLTITDADREKTRAQIGDVAAR